MNRSELKALNDLLEEECGWLVEVGVSPASGEKFFRVYETRPDTNANAERTQASANRLHSESTRSANREISLLSHIYNIGREWGLTDKENPAAGVRKNKETPRAFYASAEIWDAVYKQAVPELRDATDLAYLTGQRPGDVLSMRAADVVDGFLQVAQGKTAKKLRIRLSYGENLNQLGVLIERLLEQRRRWSVRNPYLIITDRGMKVSAAMLRLRFDDARLQAVKEALESQDTTLAESVRQFQFRDIRPKAASEIDDLGDASRLLGHTDKRITETVYRRVGEIVKPTR